jgi:hypothetical protein
MQPKMAFLPILNYSPKIMGCQGFFAKNRQQKTEAQGKIAIFRNPQILKKITEPEGCAVGSCSCWSPNVGHVMLLSRLEGAFRL